MKRTGLLLSFVAAALVLAGCSGGQAATTSSATPTYPAYEQIIRDYWAAFNQYDLEKCVSYLEPAYAERRRSGIESELDQFQMGKILGVQMVVDSVSAPATMEDGRLEVKVTMKIWPRGLSDDRYLMYYLVEVDGVLKIARQTDDPDKTPPGREPQNLAAEVVGNSQVNLTWEERSSAETGVLVRRSTDRAAQTDVVDVTLPADSNSYTDTTVEPGTTYYYRVYAFNKAGNSDQSNIVTVVIPAS
jgi:hypothetical protein